MVTEQQFYDAMRNLRREIKEDLDSSMVTYIRNQNEICLLHKRSTDNLYSSINGNGKPGLKSDVEQIKTTLKIYNWVIAVSLTVTIGILTKSIVTYLVKI